MTIKQPICVRYFWSVAALTVLLLLYCSFQLRTYYSNYNMVKHFFEALESPCDNKQPLGFSKYVVHSINLQLAEDSANNIFGVIGDNSDANYIRKLVAAIYDKMHSMVIQVVDIKSNENRMCCKLMIGDKAPYVVSFYFFEKGDSIILTNVTNLGPLCKSIKCRQKFNALNIPE